MSILKNMPAAGLAVIVLIAALFALALVVLFIVCARYRRLSRMVNDGRLERENSFLRYVVNEFASAYKQCGDNTNTPTIVANAVGVKLKGLLLCERFLNNAVSLFVTLGLFGTFLGLSLSVSSLTELIGYSNTDQWLSVLDSVGEGLMSALGGMGVAFYTSLVGVACAILLTVLRTIFSPQACREDLESQLELWLDHTVSPTLPTAALTDDASLVRQLIGTLNGMADSVAHTLHTATDEMQRTLESGRAPLAEFNKTVGDFNEGVRDFSEFNYNLRGTVERMDVSVRGVVESLREVTRTLERSAK